MPVCSALRQENIEAWRIPSISAQLCNTQTWKAAINPVNNHKADHDMNLEIEHIAPPAKSKRSAPASGYFGYTQANLANPRSKTLEAESFARHCTETGKRVCGAVTL